VSYVVQLKIKHPLFYYKRYKFVEIATIILGSAEFMYIQKH